MISFKRAMQLTMMTVILFALIATSWAKTCSIEIVDAAISIPQFRLHNYYIQHLSLENGTYCWDNTIDYKFHGCTDSSGVPLLKIDDTFYYHPVQIAQFALRMIDGYLKTNNNEYLVVAENCSEELMNNAHYFNGVPFFPYNFDYAFHKMDYMIAPWYSGMAQGQILSLMAKLYQITGDNIYLDNSMLIFQSLADTNQTRNPWVSYIDKRGYFWIEEYPLAGEESHVLNGFIYALYGIYDFYLVSNDECALQVLRGGLYTIENHITEYRNPGYCSSYDLKYREINPRYHAIHIDQLNMIYKITGHIEFHHMAELMKQDYYP